LSSSVFWTAPDSNDAPQQPEWSLQPIASVTLTALGPKHQAVLLGSGRPHLVVFFAGWLGHDSDLPRASCQLDSYATLARRRGWPSPVAVDELTTEPSLAEAPGVLAPLAATLQTPIVEDATRPPGRTYHFNDLPWFVLNSATGKILWNHDGWISAATLNRQVAQALAGN